MEQAIDKIRDEMASSAKDLNVQYIGEQLTKHIMAHPADAPKIYEGGKTIEGALKKLEEYARQHRNGSMACIDPETGMRIVLGYYGVTADEQRPTAVARHPMMVSDDLDLDALLEM